MQAGASYVRSRLCSKEPLFFGMILFNALTAGDPGGPLGALLGEGASSRGPKGGGPLGALVTPGIAVAVPVQEANISIIERLGVLSSFSRKAFDEAFPEPTERPPFSGRV